MIDAAFTPRELGARKTDSAYWAALLKTINEPPSACVVVGDDLNGDILPAINAGLRTIWLTTTANQQSMAGAVIATMDDLPATVEALHGPA
jgi:putative hydrolase of the HAD superfamily